MKVTNDDHYEENCILLTKSNTSKDKQHQSPLQTTDIIATILFSYGSFSVTLCFALLTTFFPEEGARKGATEWETGLIFSAYELGSLMSSLVFGTYMTFIGSKFLLVAGIACLAISTFLFGTLVYSQNGSTFVLLCMTVRLFQGVSGSAGNTAILVMVATRFPGRITRVVGFLESSSGMAFILGPIVGGSLYQAGGFLAPFLVIGGLNLIAATACWVFLPSQSDIISTTTCRHSTRSTSHLLKLPGMWLPVSSLLLVSTTMGYLDLSLGPRMDMFGVTSTEKGATLAIISVTYIVMGFLLGRLPNNRVLERTVMACGSVITGLSVMLLGPTPIFRVDASMWLMGLALAFLGLGIAAQIVLPFQDMLHIARSNDFSDDLYTNGLVSGLANFCIPLGGFIGPTIGGFLNEVIGFQWSTTSLATGNLAFGLLFLLTIIRKAS